MTTPDDKRLAQGPPLPHTAIDYRRGCRCSGCTSRHNEVQKTYGKNTRASVRSMKLQLAAQTDELEELRAFRDQFLSLAAQVSGEQVSR